MPRLCGGARWVSCNFVEVLSGCKMCHAQTEFPTTRSAVLSTQVKSEDLRLD